MFNIGPWKPEEVQRARELYIAGMTLDNITKHLPGRSANAVGSKLFKLGMTGLAAKGKAAVQKSAVAEAPPENFVEWTRRQEAALIELWYQNAPLSRIVEKTKHTEEQIGDYVKRMGVHDRNSPTFKADSRGKRLRVCMTCQQVFMSSGAGNRLCGCVDTGGYHDTTGAGRKTGGMAHSK
jgi:hypothetical protein